MNEPENFEPATGSYGHVQRPYHRLTGFDPKFRWACELARNGRAHVEAHFGWVRVGSHLEAAYAAALAGRPSA